MTTPDEPLSATPAPHPTRPSLVPISRGELFWLTAGMWLGGVSILTLLPVVMTTQLGLGQLASVVGSYFLFFLAWQPIQTITQRSVGTRAALVRTLLLVIMAFSVAFLLRATLFGTQE